MCRIRQLVLSITPLVTANLAAQRLWSPPDGTRNVGIEINKGFYKSSPLSRISFTTFTVTAQGRFPVNDVLAITAAIPVAQLNETTPEFVGTPAQSISETALGNPWLGIEVQAGPGLIFETGLRPGIASTDKDLALGIGVVDDFDRFEAWLPKVTSARAMAQIGTIPAQGAFVTGLIGGTVTFPSASIGGNPESYANYGLRGGLNGNGVLSSITVTGRLYMSGSGGTLAERTVHQLAFTTEGTDGMFRPSFSIRVYLKDQLRKQVDAILTVGASIVY